MSRAIFVLVTSPQYVVFTPDEFSAASHAEVYPTAYIYKVEPTCVDVPISLSPIFGKSQGERFGDWPDREIKVNDNVRILKYPEDSADGYGRVVSIHAGKYWVSNLNQPYCGSFSGLLSEKEIKKS